MSDKTNKRLSFLINAAYAVVVAVILYISFKYVISWIMPFILAFCIVSVVQPLIRFIKQKLKFKQEIAAVMIMLLIYMGIGSIIIVLATQLIILIKQLFVAIPDYYSATIYPGLLKATQVFSDFINELPAEWQVQFNDLQGTIMDTLQNLVVSISQKGLSFLSNFTNSIPSFLIAFMFTVMLSFFISIQYDKVISFIKIQIPDKAKRIIKDTRIIFKDTVLKYIKAYLILMVITFIELTIGFVIIGVDNAVVIAAGIAVFDLLPFFGTGAIMVPWIIVVLLQGNLRFALGLAIVYGVVTLIRNILEPKVVGDQLGLNPIVSLMAIYLGFRLFGVLGMIAMPVIVQMALALQKNGTINLYKENNSVM